MMMRDRYLQMTYRKGRPLAAYFYLERRAGDKSARTEQFDGGLIIDYAQDDRPIGIEITDPTNVSIDAINDVLKRLGLMVADPRDLEPLRAA